SESPPFERGLARAIPSWGWLGGGRRGPLRCTSGAAPPATARRSSRSAGRGPRGGRRRSRASPRPCSAPTPCAGPRAPTPPRGGAGGAPPCWRARPRRPPARARAAGRGSRTSAPRELPAQDLRERLGGEAELEERHALVEVLPVGGDLPAGELEDAHSREADLAAGAPRDGVAHDVAERPLRGRALVVLDHVLH